jgi:hypothetical protein
MGQKGKKKTEEVKEKRKKKGEIKQKGEKRRVKRKLINGKEEKENR